MKKRVASVLAVFYFFFGIAKISAEAVQPEIGNELMQMMSFSTDDPSYVTKPDLGEKSSNSVFWPEVPFLERILSALFPPTHKPLIMWRVRFFLGKNNSDEQAVAATTEGATVVEDQELVQKIGPTSSILVSTEKISKSSRRKRNKKDRQLAKPIASNMLSLENYYDEGKNVNEKVKSKNEKKFMAINGISSHLNKSLNSTRQDCYRRLYTYVWSIDWNSLFVPIVIVFVFVLILTVAIAYCHILTNAVQVQVKRVNPSKYNKVKALEVYSMC